MSKNSVFVILRLDRGIQKVFPLTTCGNDRNKIQATDGQRKGRESLESGNKEEAMKCFEKAISIDPDWQEPRENLKKCKEK